MRQLRDEAYVLGTRELGEADLIVTLFAEREGRVRGVARGARKSRRRFGGALEPMTRVHATWLEREGRELHRLETLDPVRSYAAMQADPARQAACAVLAEITDGTAREGAGEPKLFRLLGAVLDALAAGLPPLLAVRYFEFWTLKLHGVLPDIEACARCSGRLEPRARRWACAEQGLLCSSCRRNAPSASRILGVQDREFLRTARTMPPAAMEPYSRAARAGGSLDLLLRGALQQFLERPVRSYRYLERAVAACGGGAVP